MKSTLALKSSHDKVIRTEFTFLSKTSSQDGWNIWNNGLQDTVHHAKRVILERWKTNEISLTTARIINLREFPE